MKVRASRVFSTLNDTVTSIITVRIPFLYKSAIPCSSTTTHVWWHPLHFQAPSSSHRVSLKLFKYFRSIMKAKLLFQQQPVVLCVFEKDLVQDSRVFQLFSRMMLFLADTNCIHMYESGKTDPNKERCYK